MKFDTYPPLPVSLNQAYVLFLFKKYSVHPRQGDCLTSCSISYLPYPYELLTSNVTSYTHLRVMHPSRPNSHFSCTDCTWMSTLKVILHVFLCVTVHSKYSFPCVLITLLICRRVIFVICSFALLISDLHPFSHSVNIYLLNICFSPGTLPGIGSWRKSKVLCLISRNICVGGENKCNQHSLIVP